MNWSDLYPAPREPSLSEISAFIDNPLWDELCGHIENTYDSRPLVTHSGCGMAPGWNVKYKKAGRSLCTLYPAAGSFCCMVMASVRDDAELELLISQAAPYTRDLYRRTVPFQNSRWLMVEVTTSAILADVKALLRIRRKSK